MNKVTSNSTDQIQGLLIRMERNKKIVQRFSKKLTSYTCEPNNSSCFEKLYELRRGFKAFTTQQNHIMDLIKQKQVSATRLKEDILKHLEQFNQLEKDIAAYLLDTNRYS